jgi:hypothetical protein
MTRRGATGFCRGSITFVHRPRYRSLHQVPAGVTCAVRRPTQAVGAQAPRVWQVMGDGRGKSHLPAPSPITCVPPSQPVARPTAAQAERPHAAGGNTAFASNTGPSTHTRFIASPLSVITGTAQPAQPPTAQAMNSSSDTWQGTP